MYAPAAQITPYIYTQPLYEVMAGVFIFKDPLNLWEGIGIGIIVITNIFCFYMKIKASKTPTYKNV